MINGESVVSDSNWHGITVNYSSTSKKTDAFTTSVPALRAYLDFKRWRCFFDRWQDIRSSTALAGLVLNYVSHLSLRQNNTTRLGKPSDAYLESWSNICLKHD